MRAAAVQLNSTEDKKRNLERADRLTREAAADGAELIVLPEKFNVLGTHEDYLAGAETLDGPTIGWARDTARELGVDLVAGLDRRAARGAREALEHLGARRARTVRSRPSTARSTCSTWRSTGRSTASPTPRSPGEEGVLSELAGGRPLGLTVCYDLRFPELYRLLAVEGARVVTLPAAFTKVTGQAHWEILIRARAIEDQVFVVAADQIGTHPPDKESFGGSMIVDPWGEVLAQGARRGVLRGRGAGLRAPGRGAREAAEPGQPPGGRLRAWERRTDGRRRPASPGVDKRRLILDAAIRVFARRGFHHCRVSDVADEAGVAYGLVYHYFDSKEEILNTLFLERWQIMLDAIAEIDAKEDVPARDKLYLVAGFIIDSYRHDPDLMKVIIVEVTRSAHSFGRLHLDKIQEAYAGIAKIIESGPGGGHLQGGHLGGVRRDVLLRRDRAAPLRLDLRPAAADRGGVRALQGPRGGHDLRRPRVGVHRCLGAVWLNPPETGMDNDLVKRLIWSGMLAGVGALATIVANRVATASGSGSSTRTRPSSAVPAEEGRGPEPEAQAASPPAASRQSRRSRRRGRPRPRRTALDAHPEFVVGAAFVGGLALAQVLKRFGR